MSSTTYVNPKYAKSDSFGAACLRNVGAATTGLVVGIALLFFAAILAIACASPYALVGGICWGLGKSATVILVGKIFVGLAGLTSGMVLITGMAITCCCSIASCIISKDYFNFNAKTGLYKADRD